MKTALWIFCLLASAHGEGNSASGQPEEVRAIIADTLKREFRFEPRQSTDQPVANEAVVVLPRFEVKDSITGIHQAIQKEQRKRTDEKFSWRSGGTMLKFGPVKVMFKYDPDRNALDLLKFSW